MNYLVEEYSDSLVALSANCNGRVLVLLPCGQIVTSELGRGIYLLWPGGGGEAISVVELLFGSLH